MASLRSQREKMVYEDALEPRGQKWDGDERRERERGGLERAQIV